MIEENKPKGILYLVATPIGNLGDISPRAVEVLEKAEIIAAEDTRVTAGLLSHLGIRKSTVSFHEHNKEESGRRILDRLISGDNCALVCDAGTPAISDPGESLVHLCALNGIEVISIPGPCAAVSALVVSALPTRRFSFEGFLPSQKNDREARLKFLKDEERTFIIYEAPHKLKKTLSDLENAFGSGRRISVCRELTKIHEEIIRTTLKEAVAYFEQNEPKGEFVLVIDGISEEEKKSSANSVTDDFEDIMITLESLIASGRSLSDASKIVSRISGFSKNSIYSAYLEKTGK